MLLLGASRFAPPSGPTAVDEVVLRPLSDAELEAEKRLANANARLRALQLERKEHSPPRATPPRAPTPTPYQSAYSVVPASPSLDARTSPEVARLQATMRKDTGSLLAGLQVSLDGLEAQLGRS